MPTTRRRSEQEFEQTPQQLGTQTLTLSGLTGGRNGHTNPELLSPQFWADPSFNVYSGLHGAVRRARWAPIADATYLQAFANATRIVDIFGFAPPGVQPLLVLDNGNTSATITLPYPITIVAYGLFGGGPAMLGFVPIAKSLLLGPYMRFSPNPGIILQTNGLARMKLAFLLNYTDFIICRWGLDAPDSSPSITLVAGTTATLQTGR